jgi:tRNA threonylcarbamoyladenosine biosynthesis protein TsaB
MSGNWLLIETSGRIGRLGLARGGAVARAADLDPARRHARDLAATADALLKAESLRPTDLTGVMVGHGPGSYTGLRVGLISAKTLAYALGCQLVPVPTFAAIAEQAPAEARVVWVIADALQGLVYIQRFDRGEGTDRWSPWNELSIEPADEWLPWLPPDVWVSGPGVAVYGEHRYLQGAKLVPEADREPTVHGLFRAGQGRPAVTRAELFALEPLYLRGSSAEEKAKAKPPG